MTAEDKDNPAADLNDQELLAFFRKTAHSSLLKLVQNRAVITAEELALAVGVSPMVIRFATQGRHTIRSSALATF